MRKVHLSQLPTDKPGALLDPLPDVELSQSASWERRVLHVSNDNYLGIRASASAAPGRKLILSNTDWHYAQHLEVALSKIREADPDVVVLHGMSNAIFEVGQAVSRFGLAKSQVSVWHGSPAQWVDPVEAAQFSRWMLMFKRGFVDGIRILSPGSEWSPDPVKSPPLLNFPPKTIMSKSQQRPADALVPATPSVYKNLYGNLLAAEIHSTIQSCFHYALLEDVGVPLTKAKEVAYDGVLGNLRRMANVSVVLNAGFMECHSMVDLEAASVGTPSIHARNDLYEEFNHPWLDICSIANPLAVSEIVRAMERLEAIGDLERVEMSRDFCESLTVEALHRWEEFLGV